MYVYIYQFYQVIIYCKFKLVQVLHFRNGFIKTWKEPKVNASVNAVSSFGLKTAQSNFAPQNHYS